jgi:hypothetical protein
MNGEWSPGNWQPSAELLAGCCSRWSLWIENPLEGGYLSRVFACSDTNGNNLVLKLSPPEMPSYREAAALTLWKGRSAVRLRDFD